MKLIKKAKKERVKTSRKKKNPPICGWCGKNHPSYRCKQPKNKWSNHFCTNCGGRGHPKAVCESNQTENDEKDVVNVVSPFNVAAKNNVILDKKDRIRFHYFALKNENSIAQGFKSLSSTEDVKNNSTNYIITNSRLKREGYLSGSENKLYTVKSGDLEIFSLYRFD